MKASADFPLTWMLVPSGLGQRLGVDRDEDGFGDRTESLFGTDTTDAASNPDLVPLTLTITPSNNGDWLLRWRGVPGRSYQIVSKDDLNQAGWTARQSVTATADVETSAVVQQSSVPARFYRLEVVP